MGEIERCKKVGFHEHSLTSRYMCEECGHTDVYDPAKVGITPRIDDFRGKK